MTDLISASGDIAAADAEVLVVGVFSGEDAPAIPESLSGVDAAFGGRLAEQLAVLGNTGGPSSLTRLPAPEGLAAKLVFAVGLGDAEDLEDEALRRAAGTAVRAAFGETSVAIAFEGDPEATAVGAALGAYKFAGYKTDGGGDAAPESIAVYGANEAATAKATVLAESVALVKDWADTPANLLRPPAFAVEIERAATAAGLDVEILDGEALAEGGYGGVLAVGGGSDAQPRLVRLSYRPEGAAKHVALVGKGITFDSGGINIKPGAGMWAMKGDMAGAAAVVGATIAAAKLGLNVAVTCTVALAENMLSGSSFRPSDVITIRNGMTVEVLNTDAEGRLVLADALSRALEDEPDAVYDVATLTGGQLIALGRRTMGLMGSEEETERLRRLGEVTGEHGWPMPFPEDIVKLMESPIADVSQCATGLKRDGHMVQGGIFLSKFVPDEIPWAHLDIAGPADSDAAYGYIAKGATGVPVRTLVAALEEFAA
ncbi:leucyl aminopeptidase [Glycomyces sp. TRM65418]|uniref:leucyl aminopeptidase n=1 Tax=Glycomyces sp. TRM65418 TaxID=2867006 RepID=UPI001CE5BD25|nr:leucyl aminopeptidase [Glycomyces sp. TRM65418]MCC3762232.1 leucyl aminopeptidase [Glycomyces sp. TRM65418]QZD56291.1 leucyl aminopeptidase [Glycomyces sp. TRM65418]